MGCYSEAVVNHGYFWDLNQLLRFELHIHGEKQVVLSPANFLFNSQIAVSGIRKLIPLTERELAEHVFPSEQNMGDWNKTYL